MKRNNPIRFLLLLFILAWAGYEMWPLQDEPGKLIKQFGKATNRDTEFDKVYEAAKADFDPKEENSNEFGTLQKAVDVGGAGVNFCPPAGKKDRCLRPPRGQKRSVFPEFFGSSNIPENQILAFLKIPYFAKSI